MAWCFRIALSHWGGLKLLELLLLNLVKLVEEPTHFPIFGHLPNILHELLVLSYRLLSILIVFANLFDINCVRSGFIVRRLLPLLGILYLLSKGTSVLEFMQALLLLLIGNCLFAKLFKFFRVILFDQLEEVFLLRGIHVHNALIFAYEGSYRRSACNWLEKLLLVEDCALVSQEWFCD